MDERLAGRIVLKYHSSCWFSLFLLLVFHSPVISQVAPEVTIDGGAQQFVVVGNEIQLTCHYNTSPPVSEVRWEKDGIVISRNGSVVVGARRNITHFNDSTVQLTIAPSNSTDSGNYTCVVINRIDNSSATASVTIQVVPGPPENVTVISKTSRVVNIFWTPGFNGNSDILNYTVQISIDNQTFSNVTCQGLSSSGCVVSSSFTSASLEGLHPGRTYYIKVFANNKVGTSTASSVITTTTDEEVPSAPPVNISARSLSSTSILVQWYEVPDSDKNGIILSYTVNYKTSEDNLRQSQVVNASTREVTLIGLYKNTAYEIEMFANTSKGGGEKSEPITLKTDEDKPDGAPQNVRGQNISSTSISVSWDEVQAELQNGVITGYNITYQSQTENNNGFVEAGPNDSQANLTGLKEFVKYNISVVAFTVKGDGPPSVTVVSTDQDRPNGAPQNVRGQNISSTSISISWDEVQAELQNGIITGYNITYQSQTENNNGFVEAGPNDRQANLTGLKEFVKYNISVVAFTLKGDGPPSVTVVSTDQDKPDGAPQRVRGQNISSTSISVSWDEVQAELQNGIITGYNITYQSQTEDNNGFVEAGPNDRQANLTGLKEFVKYNISVVAFTVKGDGPPSVTVVSTDQDKPDGSPQRVRGQNISSTSISVSWDEVQAELQNGIITGYNITYQSQTQNNNGFVEAGPNDRQANLTRLKEFVKYNISVVAFTVKGDGPPSVTVVSTDQDKPDGAPRNVRGQNTSSTSISVSWDPVQAELQNGVITGYNITYRSQTQNNSGFVEAGPNDRQANLTELKEFVDYNISVVAFTVKGDGPPSVTVVRTDEDKPDGTPQNVKGQNTSSTNISVSWEAVQAERRNGIITGYNITYQSQTENDNGFEEAGPDDRQANLTGLKEFVKYNISVVAFTAKGDGPPAIIVVRTDQDQPDGAPQNVRGHNTSSTSISVSWDEVQAELRNGIITGYTITYQSQTENNNGVVEAGPNDRQANLTGLKEYVEYTISVFASTVKGRGPPSVLDVRTDQDEPDGAPQNVRGHNTSSTSISVSWEAVQADLRNGIITGYNITYQSQTENDNGVVEAGPNDRQANLTGLKEFVKYNISVVAFTVKGDGPPNVTVVSTDEDRPDAPPQNVREYNTTSTSIFVIWDDVPSEDQNGIIRRYTVRYRSVRVEGPFNTTTVFTKEANLTGLIKDESYNVSVLATTVKGDGPYSVPKEFTTNEDVPGAAPSNVRAKNTSSTSILVQWNEVPEDKRHGKIRSYTVIWKRVQGRDQKTRDFVASVQQYELKNLTKYTEYSIQVLAATRVGKGPESNPIVTRTDEDIPSKAPRLDSAETINSTSVFLKWQPVPLDSRNGIIIRYTIHFRDEEKSTDGSKIVTASAVNATVNGLRQKAEYSFWIVAATSKGDGPPSSTEKTETKAVSTKSPPQDDAIGTNEVKVPFVNKETLSSGNPVTYFQMIVTPLKGKEDDPGNSADAKYETVELTYDTQQEGKPYITAEFPKDTFKTEFPVGDGKYYSRNGVTDSKRKRRAVVEKYLNGELDDDTKYAVFQRSFDKDNNYENEGFIIFTTNKDNTAAIVAGVVVPLIVLAIIVVVVIVYLRRRNKDQAVDGEDVPMNSKPHRTKSVSAFFRRSGIDNPNYVPGESIPVEEFEGHVRRLHANGDLLFSQEYSGLRPSMDFTWNATLAQENRFKNRYNNIVAYDHSRVCLTPLQGVPGSDYINANYLDGYRKKRAYIATQGPLPETVDDFWRMVWEQNTKTIVMVTNLEERGRVKCYQYWPSEEGSTYGDIQINLTQTVELSDFTIRTFCLKKANSRAERTVNQYHYTVWPDHGVPSCPTSLLTFVRKASGANPSDAGPMVVHCSAGVGRTGTFVVVDSMLQRIAAEKTVDVFGYVMSLRCDRNIMVQVEEQYVFIHEVLVEAIHAGYTEIRANELRAHVKRLMEVNANTGQTEMDEEFTRLGRGGAAPQSKFQAANMHYNKTKNRYANVLAFDDTRVKLSVITGIEGSDYINANFIDGYMMRRAFIATQAPIPDTIPDFWRMIWEQESSTIVMLSKETESGKVKVHRYWPGKQPANISTLMVEMTSEMVYEDYVMREIKLTNTKESASRMVRQYHYTGWPDVGSPDSGSGLIDLIGQVQKWQQKSGNTTITVHCSAGVGRTGVFCALSLLIERLKAEGVVDVFQTVKQLRSQRPAMVQTKDQYEFIYHALGEYLDSFDAYNNFE